ncbi:MAG: PhnD/SsuA/transferrin family substrate-binding protein [Alphaproteobacteria bacterium]|nr:PhnD/SsuA/transferrin family substrate-binding protein [Alphaproteobacteria bacterium]MBF0249909.1 PhnD/SsuA/transferrin family substrate-binding protein [Alphaproteobacteria bacterium]
MRVRGALISILAVFVWGMVFFPSFALAGQDLVVGIFPRRDAAATMKLFKPLGAYLEQALNQPVRIETAPDFATFELRVGERRYDLIHCNQNQYLEARAQAGYDVIAQNEEFGEPGISGAIYVRKDSGIDTVAQLRGKTVLFGGGKSAMMSYIVPTFLLRQGGLMDGDYIEQFASTPPNAVLAVSMGHADAAGAGEVVRRMTAVKTKIDVEQLNLLAVSDAMAHLPWAVRDDMPSARRDRLRAALIGLSETDAGREVLKAAQLTALNPAVDPDYDPLRTIIRSIQGGVEPAR